MVSRLHCLFTNNKCFACYYAGVIMAINHGNYRSWVPFMVPDKIKYLTGFNGVERKKKWAWDLVDSKM